MTKQAESLDRVVVIGSGLSALGAIKSLVAKGIHPTVLDVGDELEPNRAKRATALSIKSPDGWSALDREWLNSNPTVGSTSRIPKKLVFGSSYFYGESRREALIKAEGCLPPFSYALSGLSAGWGAAVLPPHADDLHDWPITADELQKYCSKVLEGLPYSAVDDGLNIDFPSLVSKPISIRLSNAGKTFLSWMTSGVKLRKGVFLYGQARLMVRPEAGMAGQEGCQYCGQCSSGCAYGAIFKAGDEIKALEQAGKIRYIKNRLVDRLEEQSGGGRLYVRKLDESNSPFEELEFDRVFLAAGAVNSTRIVMNSLKAFDRTVDLKTRGGYVMPVASLRGVPRDWPNCNTQPELFIELKPPGEHWVHAQVSLENELVVQKLGLHSTHRGLLSRLKRKLARHLVFLLVNYHSEHSGVYELQLRHDNIKFEQNKAYLQTRQKSRPPNLRTLWSSMLLLTRNLIRIGCIPLLPFAQLNSGSYHVGCTLPMRKNPEAWNDTDTLGRINGWKNIHIADTSVFPSLPGTTIGLLAMANAWRIVEQAYSLNKSKES